jgi:8-oxo-dGTP pyrophosphatase MutT (NUDIX family)
MRNTFTPEELSKINKPAAAGLLIITMDGEFLLTRRSIGAHYLGGHWSVPSGESNVNEMESLESCARREFFEETKYSIPTSIRLLLIDKYFADNRLYFLFMCKVKEKFRIEIDFEHDEYGWFKKENLPEPIAPQILDAISRL